MTPDIRASAPPAVLRTSASEGLALEAAEAAEGSPRRFSGIAYTGVPMRLNAYFHPVVIDLAGLTVPRQDLPALREHDPGRIVGHTESVEVLAQRVKVTGLVSGTGEAADEVRGTAKNGFPWQLSVTATPTRIEFVEANQTVKVNGRTWSGPLLVARATTLREVSFVPLGADGATSANVAASLGGVPMSFEQWLEAKFGGVTLTDAQKASLQAAWKAEQTPANPPPVPPTPSRVPAPGDPVADVLAGATGARTRREEMARLAQRALDDGLEPERVKSITDLAAEHNWDVKETELQLLRASRPTAPAYGSASGRDMNNRVIEAALCRTAGLQGYEEEYDERTLEAADRHFRNGIGLVEVLHICATRRGYRGSASKGNIEAMLEHAFEGRDIRADLGPSTLSVSSALSNVANKFTREAFMAVEDEWKKFCAIDTVTDFKETTTVSLTGDLNFKRIGSSGEITHGTLGNEVYENQAEEFGRLLGISYRQFRNDDLGVFKQVGKRLGRGGALTLNLEIFTELLAGQGTFYDAANGNYDDGTDTAFSSDGVTAAVVIWDAKTDPDGNPFGSKAKVVLVPPKFRIAQKKLFNSANIAAADEEGTDNPHAGMYLAACSTYIANSNITGYSVDAWYMFADPLDTPAIAVCFLDGRQMPEVTSASMSPDRRGVYLVGTFDFGVRKQEKRSVLKLKGTA